MVLFLVSLLYERKCLRIDLLKIKCSVYYLFYGTPAATTRKQFVSLLIGNYPASRGSSIFLDRKIEGPLLVG